MQVELKQIIGVLSTDIGQVEVPQACDRVIVNGAFAGYLDHRPGAKIYGVRPNIPASALPEIAAEVKKLRPDMDDSEVSSVSLAAVEYANREEETEVDDDGDE